MIIIDVREPVEFDAEYIQGSINLPLSSLSESSHAFFQEHQERDVIIMCRAGVRAE